MGTDKHYSDEQWADFVRGIGAPTLIVGMQSHLDLVCPSCLQIVKLLSIVEKAAIADSTFTVPQALVDQAAELFQPEVSVSNWTDRLLELPLILFRQQRNDWVPQGVRSTGVEGSRILYRAGDYALDLNLETAPGEPGEIIGQIVNEQDQSQSLENLLVQVVSGGKTVGETTTNSFGEFIIRLPQRGKAVLRFALPISGRRIDIPVVGSVVRSGVKSGVRSEEKQ